MIPDEVQQISSSWVPERLLILEATDENPVGCIH